MPNQRSHVQPKPLIERIEILWNRFPRPLKSRLNRLERNGFDMGHNPGEIVTVFLVRRRHRPGGVADHDRGHTMVARVRAERIPGDLGIVMRMVVDNSWGDHQAAGIHDSLRSPAHYSTSDYT